MSLVGSLACLGVVCKRLPLNQRCIPFSSTSGATTGTGGRIRDVQAAGRGGHVVAGTAGYCFGNLLIPG